MNDPLDRAYLEWLYKLVGPGHTNPRVTHWELLRQMYEKEFVWFVPNDDNRMEDGRELRYDFIQDAGLRRVDASWLGMGCSFLEVVVGLSRRLSFEAEGEPSEWFWHMIRNLSLVSFTDSQYKRSDKYTRALVEDAMETVIWRNYHPDGRGGLFPLDHPRDDQRKIELWYQLCAYLLERD